MYGNTLQLNDGYGLIMCSYIESLESLANLKMDMIDSAVGVVIRKIDIKGKIKFWIIAICL